MASPFVVLVIWQAVVIRFQPAAQTPAQVDMSDTSTIWNSAISYGDWQLSGTNLTTGNDLITAVLISLFTDRLTNSDDVIPDGTTDRRGWVGDLDADVQIGSRLWLLSRAKLTKETAVIAKNMAQEALQWMIDDSVVASFDIITEVIFPNRLNMQVVAYKKDGTRIALDLTHAWMGLK
jgi:phage gp46-like protein